MARRRRQEQSISSVREYRADDHPVTDIDETRRPAVARQQTGIVLHG